MRRTSASLTMLMMLPLGAQKAPPALEFGAEVRINVDAGGRAAIDKIEKIARLKPDSVVYDKVAGLLTQRIPRWEFVPATRDGVAVPSQTTLRLDLEASDNGNGGLSIMVLDARTGPGIAAMDGPSDYPAPAEAVVILVVTLSRNGSVGEVHVEHGEVMKDRRSTYAIKTKPFEESAMRAASSWRFVNETVAGEPKLGRVRVPVSFCLSGDAPWCSSKQPGSEARRNAESIALEPAVKLRSAVAGTAL